MSNYDFLIAVGSFLSGAGALISALFAWKSVQASKEALDRANEQDKRHVWTEIQTLSARAASIFKSVERVATNLKLEYKTLAVFGGQGAGGSRLNAYLDRVEKELSDARASAENSKQIAASFTQPSKLDYESAVDTRARLEANAIRLSLTLDLLKDELSGIARQNDQFRERVINQTRPQPAGLAGTSGAE
ncbi:hypothetical protein ACU4I5_05695 [Ensifer adhaerens]